MITTKLDGWMDGWTDRHIDTLLISKRNLNFSIEAQKDECSLRPFHT